MQCLSLWKYGFQFHEGCAPLPSTEEQMQYLDVHVVLKLQSVTILMV